VIRLRKQHVTDEQLADYLEGELSAEQRWIVRQHVTECAQCAARLEAWQQLIKKESVRRLTEMEKGQLWNRIQIETERKKEKKVWFDKRSLIIGWSVSCVIFLLLGYLWGSQGHEEQMPHQLSLTNHEHRISGLSPDQVWNSPLQHVAWYSPNEKQFIVYIYDPNVVHGYSVAFQADLFDKISPLQTGFWSEGVMQHNLIEPYLINVWQRCGTERLNCSSD
jgi:hypothetical protein